MTLLRPSRSRATLLHTRALLALTRGRRCGHWADGAHLLASSPTTPAHVAPRNATSHAARGV